MMRGTGKTLPGALVAVGLLAGLPSIVAAAEATPVIRVSEVCTTCIDVIRCARDVAAPAPASPPVVVYQLHEKTFWQQVATIWDYLIRFGKAKPRDVRVLTVYELPAGAGTPRRVIPESEAILDATTMTIDVPGARINRITGAWSVAGTGGAATLQPAGRCELLPVGRGMELLRSLRSSG